MPNPISERTRSHRLRLTPGRRRSTSPSTGSPGNKSSADSRTSTRPLSDRLTCCEKSRSPPRSCIRAPQDAPGCGLQVPMTVLLQAVSHRGHAHAALPERNAGRCKATGPGLLGGLMPIKALEPELIGTLFGRLPARILPQFIRPIKPRTRFTIIALVAIPTVLVMAGLQHRLAGTAGSTDAWSIIRHPTARPGRVSFPLYADVASVIEILVALATPVFCARQVELIGQFVAINERNSHYRISELRVNDINEVVGHANRHFRRIGDVGVSASLLIGSILTSVGMYVLLWRYGLLRSWNPTNADAREWGTSVLRGWWANISADRWTALALIFFGTYLVYFVLKQVLMGAVFTQFSQAALKVEFGAVPNLGQNTDGYWGLRPIRQLLTWTYVVTLAHFFATIAFFIVWLPVTEWTIVFIGGLMISQGLVVCYPSWIMLNSAVQEKERYIKYLNSIDMGAEERERVVDRIWNTSNLPFRLRNTLTAVALYVLTPIAVAVVSSLLGLRRQ